MAHQHAGHKASGRRTLPASTKVAVARPKTQGSHATPKVPAVARPKTSQCTSRPTEAKAAVPSFTSPQQKAKNNAAEAAERQQQREIDERIVEVFRLADGDLSGSINFVEFARLHREFMQIAGHMMESSCGNLMMTDEEVEKNFRENDRDHNMELDIEEWNHYMKGLLSVLGVRAFLQACTRFLEEERQKMASDRGAYDAISSNSLLEKVKILRDLRTNSEAVEALIQNKANPDFYDENGSNVLFFAVPKADVGLIHKLMEAKGNPSKRNKDMDSAILVAARACDIPMLRLLLTATLPEEVPSAEQESRASSVELIKGMCSATGKQVRDLLSKKADPNFRNDTGWTPLTAAVFFGNEECMSSLLKSQGSGVSAVKMDQVDLRGRTALHVAARKGRSELVQPLLRGNASPDAQDLSGWTPLHHAAFNGEDACIAELAPFARLAVKDEDGFTPWMIALGANQAAKLSDSSMQLLQPPESVGFTKKVIPILANSDMSTYDKLQALYSLPGVNSMPENLRFYEACFHPRSGPNKVRLVKTWEGIAEALLRRERTGETDIEEPGPGADDRSRKEVQANIRSRREEQSAFLEHWLQLTAGPRSCQEWTWDNREAIRDVLLRTVENEAEQFTRELDEVYKRVQQDEHGAKLCQLELEEVLLPELRSQYDAHPMLLWLENLDVGAVFDSLCDLGVKGMTNHDEVSLMAFSRLVTNEDFSAGVAFWRNIYKLWLSSYAQKANLLFQQHVQNIIDDFNTMYHTEGLEAYRESLAPKSYEEMRQQEAKLGRATHDSLQGRSIARGFLDVVRCALTVNCPRAAVLLCECFRSKKLKPDNFQLVRLENGFHKEARGDFGYRDLVLIVHWTGQRHQNKRGTLITSCHKETSQAIVGEVRINLEKSVAVKKRMCLLQRFLGGDFDHKAVGSEGRPPEKSRTAMDFDEPPQ
eukprot:TRINITY_DN21278_c0_g1_i1.p1 TRINITY_DN21278_c0_g1~~TRINITY_DN21278_c0_g1_i1.p1  ORF type:complete len:935 (-),score=175.73 TRINITY_DN21278_c0_g1_i1:39-2843(-)